MSNMSTHATDIPELDRAEAGLLAATENERFAALVASLVPADWEKPTDCPDWDVRGVATHVLGAMQSNVSLREFVHQFLAGTKAAGDRPQVDGMTEVQVRERRSLSPRAIAEQLTALAPRAARARHDRPRLMRRMRFGVDVGGVMEKWRMGYLLDTIYTRDTWMHRIDVSRATRRPVELTAEHDGRIVADVVAEWARRHGKPFTLTLEGAAGGTYSHGDGGEDLLLDAVEFCRILSGRGSGSGLLAQVVPF
jgi:uncharacterized protein (TIGR03083 family)